MAVLHAPERNAVLSYIFLRLSVAHNQQTSSIYFIFPPYIQLSIVMSFNLFHTQFSSMCTREILVLKDR